MSSTDRILAVLGLFDEDHSVWSVEAAALALGVSASSTYRYFRGLSQAGLLDPVEGAGYCLGPEIIALDRVIRVSDSLLHAAKPAMKELLSHTSGHQMVILCRLYREQVMCVHQETGLEPVPGVSYERGRPMSMFKGATSKIILAHLPQRTLKRLYSQNQDDLEDNQLFSDWNGFIEVLKRIRKAGYSVGRGEIDIDRVGIAAPVFSGDEAHILGSLTIIGTSASMQTGVEARLKTLVMAAAAEISAQLSSGEGKVIVSAPRAIR